MFLLIESRFFCRPIHARASRFQSFLGPALLLRSKYIGDGNDTIATMTSSCCYDVTVATVPVTTSAAEYSAENSKVPELQRA